MELATWLFSAMTTFVPLSVHAWQEPTTITVARYRAIAADLQDVSEEAPLFAGRDGVAMTALMLASIASWESSFRPEVDGFHVRGDHGKAWGLLQAHLRPGETCASRKACLRVGLSRVRESFRTCRDFTKRDWLSAYTTGVCQAGERTSRERFERAMKFWEDERFVAPRTRQEFDRPRVRVRAIPRASREPEAG